MAANWHASEDDWRAYFSAFPKIVLVANSDAADMSGLRERHGADALYVFFNKAYKVLTSPFEGRALLVARSSPAGANIVYRKEVGTVLDCFAPGSLDGILNLICGGEEAPSPASDFCGAKVGWFHAGPLMTDFYPQTHLPTSGFALAVFLSDMMPSRVVLEGFSAVRSVRWKLFDDHDWTFEQTVIRLLGRTGRLVVPGLSDRPPLVRIASRYPDIPVETIALASEEVLATRLASANQAIDRLFQLTRVNAGFDGFLRRLKPKTRKERLQGSKNRDGKQS
ncbi:MAG: 3-deoxy-manno-octulosonate cytidylyltransferase [Fulvimarina manganoxydans]|uniref:3-deoxy-manno-octulosonate cytidylyltransferase n=1 Tax=Fulvimarina manganoxydans TaxID=937218 RepID=UPI002353BFA4|nr:3-deoxy-manno-octulosonate cytidylyltransferase [Fulvimarina manganoxydans]MCK5932704.1 3-deoxy-manno-octulosonate cytidylyltransferase [Fulvimarina manganoxydans]